MIPDQNLTHTSLPIEKLGDIDSRILVGLVLSIILIMLMINAVTAVILANNKFDRGQEIVEKKWQLLQGLEDPVDYILLGDSSPNQAFDPQIVIDELDLYGVNLATIGTFGFVDDVWFLQSYLESYDAPKTVIIAHSFDVPQRDFEPLELLGTYHVPLTSAITHSKLSDFSYIENAFTVYQRRLFPLHYRNQTVIRVINRFLRGQLDKPEVDFFMDDYGFMPWNNGTIINIEEKLDFTVQLIMSEQYPDQFSEVNLRAIQYITELAQEYHFDLYFANGTNYVELEKIFPTIRSKLDQQYEDIAKTNSNTHYISTTFTFPLEAMESLDHIYADYAQQYTRELMSLVWANP